MNRLALLGSVLILGALGQARADQIEFAFSATAGGGTITVTGSVLADDLGGGVYHAVSGSGVYHTGAGDTPITLIPGGGGGPTISTSPAGAFYYDNLVYPSANPTLDYWGLLFNLGPPFPPYSGVELNLFSTGPDLYSVWVYSSASGGYVVADDGATVDVTAVPAPTGLVLAGLGGLGLRAFRRRRTAA